MNNLSGSGYKVFRLLTFVCLAIIVVFAALYYFDVITDKWFAILSGVIALVAGILGVFANKPIEKDDVALAVDKLLLTYDQETLQRLKRAKAEEAEIVEFIERRSYKIFLLKLRTHLQESVEYKYRNSEIAKLVEELIRVEESLDVMKVDYAPIKVPERFKRLLKELDEVEQIDLSKRVFLEMIASIPFLPFKPFFQAAAKAAFRFRKQWIIENLPRKSW